MSNQTTRMSCLITKEHDCTSTKYQCRLQCTSQYATWFANAPVNSESLVNIPANSSVNPPINIPAGSPVNVPVNLPVYVPVIKLVMMPVKSPVNSPVNIPVDSSVNSLVNVPVATVHQPVPLCRQPVNQSISQSICQSICHSSSGNVCWSRFPPANTLVNIPVGLYIY